MSQGQRIVLQPSLGEQRHNPEVRNMAELLQKFSGGDLVVLIALLLSFLVGGVIAVTAIVTAHLRKARLAEQEAFLKQEMLQRGMSADEIVQVVAATRGNSAEAASPAPAPLARTVDYQG